MSTCEYPPRAPGRPRMNSSASRTSSQRGKSASSVTSSPNGPHAPRYFTDVEGMLTKSIEEQMINQARPPFKADGTARRTSATRRADAGMGWGSSSRDSSQRDSVVELIRKRKNHIADEVLAPIHNLIGVSDYFKTRPAFYRCSSGDESGLSAENYGGVHQRPPQRPGRNAHTLRGSARGRARTTPYNGAPNSKKQQDAYSTDADSEQFFDTNADMELLAQIKQRELKKAARPNVSMAASKGKPPKPRRAVPVNPPPSKQSEVEEMVFDGSQSSFVLSPKSRQCEGCRVAHVWRGSDGKLRLARSASAEPRERSRSASPSSRSPRKQINRIKHILRNVRRRVNHADEKLRQRSDQVFIQTLLEELARYDVSKEALLAYLTEGVKERDHEDVVTDKSPAAPPSFPKRIREEAMMEEKQDKPVSGPKKRSSSDSSSSTSWMSADDDHEVKPERDPKRNAQDKKKKHSRGKKAGSSRSSARSNLVDAATSPMGEKDAPDMVASYASPDEWETQEVQPEPTGVVRVHKREAYDLGQRGALMMLEIKERHEISNEEQLLRQSMEIVDAAEREVPPRRRVSLADPHIQSVVEGQRLDSEEPPLPEVVAQPDPTEEEAEILSDDEASARRGIARAEECIALELQHNVLVFEETFLRRDVEEKEDADRSAVVDQCVGETVDALAERASRSSDVARSPSRTTEVSQSESRRSGRKKRPERRMYFVPTNIVDIGDLDEEAGEILDETTSLLLPSSKPTTADNTVDRGSSISNSRAHNSSKVVYFSNNSGIVDPVDGPRSRSSTPHKQDSVVMYFAPASEKLDEHASTPDPDRASPNVEEEQQEKPSLHLSQSSPGASSRTPSSPRDSAGAAEDLSEPAHIDYTAEMEAREAGHSATEAPVSVDDSSRGHSGQRVDEVANASARSRETITSGGGPSTSRTVPMEHAEVEDGMAHMDHVEQHRTPPSAGEKSPALSSVPEDPLGSFQSRSGAGDWMIAN